MVNIVSQYSINTNEDLEKDSYCSGHIHKKTKSFIQKKRKQEKGEVLEDRQAQVK